MKESPYARLRGKPRFRTSLNATYRMQRGDAPRQACRIANLSATGASLRFARDARVEPGAAICLDIIIPGTIMHVPVDAEVVWTRTRAGELLAGIRFEHVLSGGMVLRLAGQAAERRGPGAVVSGASGGGSAHESMLKSQGRP